MKIESNLKSRPYTEKEVVRIVNELQFKKYIKNRVYPIDIYSSIDSSGQDIVVYIFLKEDTKDVYAKWINHELR